MPEPQHDPNTCEGCLYKESEQHKFFWQQVLGKKEYRYSPVHTVKAHEEEHASPEDPSEQTSLHLFERNKYGIGEPTVNWKLILSKLTNKQRAFLHAIASAGKSFREYQKEQEAQGRDSSKARYMMLRIRSRVSKLLKEPHGD